MGDWQSCVFTKVTINRQILAPQPNFLLALQVRIHMFIFLYCQRSHKQCQKYICFFFFFKKKLAKEMQPLKGELCTLSPSKALT